MDTIGYQGLIGVSLAMYLWLISAGLTIIFGVLGVINFAHGSLFMVGAYMAYTFYGLLGLPFGLSVLLSLAVAGLLGLIMGFPPAGCAYLDRLALRWRVGVQRRYWPSLRSIETGISFLRRSFAVATRSDTRRDPRLTNRQTIAVKNSYEFWKGESWI